MYPYNRVEFILSSHMLHSTLKLALAMYSVVHRWYDYIGAQVAINVCTATIEAKHKRY